MKLLVFGDLHATDGNELCFNDPAKLLQHYRVEKFHQDVVRIYREYDCSGIIDLGDTTNDRTSVSLPTLELISQSTKLLPASDWNFKLIGNHETYLRNGTISTRSLFEHKFNVIDTCDIFEFGPYMAFFCSYSSDFEDLSKWITEGIEEYKNYPKILFGHFEVVGARLNSGTALQGVPVDILNQFKLCLLGHIHIPQTLGKSIHYIGSPFQQHWGEAGENKRVAILDTEDLSLKWVPMTGYPNYEQVKLDQFKKLANQKTENRYKVTLTTQSETEEFFRHPLFHQAEPVYTYAEVAAEDQPVQEDWSFDGLAKRYMALVPPAAAGMELEESELLDLGKMIASGNI